MNKPLVSIILPTYNEKQNIEELIVLLHKTIPYDKELIIVDDDSPDGTADAVRLAQKKYPTLPIRLIVRKKNHGLVASLNTGIDQAKGSIIAWMDADFSHPPYVLKKLLDAVKNNSSDASVASRFVPDGKQKYFQKRDSRAAIMASTLLNKMLSYFLSQKGTDFTSGFIAIKKNTLGTEQLHGNYGEYFIDLIMRLHKKQARVCEIGYISEPRKYGSSKTAPNIHILLSRGIHYVQFALKAKMGN